MRSLIKMKKVLIFMAIMILLALPLVVTNSYWLHLLILSLMTSALGMCFSMVFCCTGMVNLGLGAFVAIGAYASTMLVLMLGVSFWLAMPLATLTTAIIAFGFGLVAVRNPGVAFVLLTMIFAEIITQITAQISFFGGWGGFMMIPRPNNIGPMRFVGKLPFYYLMLCLFLLLAFVFQAFYSSRVGRVWKAISLSPQLAQTLGINVYRYRLLAFVIASSSAGMVGSFYAHYTQTIAPTTFGGFFSILVQLYPILGGINFYILGPVLGATIMSIIPEVLRITKELEPIITGVLVLIIVLFFPGGILGSLTAFPRFDKKSISRRIAGIGDRLWNGKGAR